MKYLADSLCGLAALVFLAGLIWFVLPLEPSMRLADRVLSFWLKLTY